MGAANYVQKYRAPNRFGITVANTNRDGTGTIVDGQFGLANGLTLAKKVLLKAKLDTTEGLIIAYLKDAGGIYMPLPNCEFFVPARTTIGVGMPPWGMTIDWTKLFPPDGIPLVGITACIAYSSLNGVSGTKDSFLGTEFCTDG